MVVLERGDVSNERATHVVILIGLLIKWRGLIKWNTPQNIPAWTWGGGGGLPYPTLPYPALPHSTLPYHTPPYPTLVQRARFPQDSTKHESVRIAVGTALFTYGLPTVGTNCPMSLQMAYRRVPTDGPP